MVAKAKANAKAKAVAQDEDETEDKDIDALLKGTWGAIGKAEDIPEGTYRLKVRNVFAKKATEKASAQLVVFFTPLEPLLDVNGGDVDSDAYEALGEGYDLSNNQVTGQFWLGEARDWQQVFDFAAKLGIEYDEVADLSREEVYKMMRNRTINGYVKSETYKDKKSFKATAFSAEE